MKEEIRRHLEAIYSQPVHIRDAAPVGGGCINETSVLTLSNGQKVFLKYNSDPPPDFFAVEARGLELLGKVAGGPLVPRVLGSRAHWLLLEYVEEAPTGGEFYAQFGRALARLHRDTREDFGLDHDNYIGKTVQRNRPEKSAVAFYRDSRFRFQQELARGKLPQELDRKLDKLCAGLDKWLDLAGEKPALLHGDLWSGNYFAGARPQSSPRPFVFDPAVYYGLREADLAMTELFGRLPQPFYDAYNEAFPLSPGYAERKNLYNLYHLLNHLNLFGATYLGAVERAVNEYV
jgi:fructosamine-3-kinase